MLIRLHASDNVLIAKSQVAIGQELPGLSARARAQIPAGHKVAASPIAKGQPVRKYNAVIGVAARDIETGDYVHTHNLAFVDFDRDPGFGLDVRPVTYVPEAERATFQGYVREDGRVGTRNFIGLISSVNCSATAISRIAAHFTPERLKDFPNVDGVAAFPQTTGCGMSSPSPHFDLLRRTLAGYARHPNMAGVLIVGLGCERNQVADLVDSQGLESGRLMRTMVMQDVGGTQATIDAGIRAVEEMLPIANAYQRQTVPASHISIGLQCGGSDGFSGITANPALGAAMDILVSHGGTAILSETPEIYGAEPPHCSPTVRCAASQGWRATALASGNIWRTRAMPFSTVWRVPPVSWMLKTCSCWPSRRPEWASQVFSWLASQPRPTTMTPQKLACRA